jgi:hypothetical protein
MHVPSGFLMVFSGSYVAFFKRFYTVSKSALLAFGHLKRVAQKIFILHKQFQRGSKILVTDVFNNIL